MGGLNLHGFLTPPVLGADFRAAIAAKCLRGARPPVDLRGVCLVREAVCAQQTAEVVVAVVMARVSLPYDNDGTKRSI